MHTEIANRWISVWSHPDEEPYERPPFVRTIRASKATAIYKMHSYWAKKPLEAIREYIAHYTRPGDVVLDPFCGSGGAGLAALSLGRTAYLGDLSPAATFIARHYTSSLDLAAFRRAFFEVARAIRPVIASFYETTCERCGGQASVIATAWSHFERCRECMGGLQKTSSCMSCKRIRAKDVRRLPEAIPVEISLECSHCATPARRAPSLGDLDRIRRLDEEAIPYWYPRLSFPDGEKTRELISKGIRWVEEIFTRRNLHALAALKAAIEEVPASQEIRDALLLVFTASLHSATRMQRCRAGGGGAQGACCYVPPLFLERNVWESWQRKFRQVACAKEEIGLLLRNAPPAREGIPPILILTRSATDLSGIPDSSVDYIFTDPAYSDQIQFGELNFLWEAWLQMDTSWREEEIVINRVCRKNQDLYRQRLRQAFQEMARVLKPNRWLTLTFHDTQTAIWEMIQEIMKECGLVPDGARDAVTLDPAQKSYNQLCTRKVAKRDLVISFRKPRPGEGGPAGEKALEADKRKVVRHIARFLYRFPYKTVDEIYDHVVSRLVRETTMHPFDLRAILEKEDIFVETAGEWRLKGQPILHRLIETNPEKEAIVFLEEKLRREPQEYGELWEAYHIGLAVRPGKELAKLLEENFIEEEGRWRLPAPEEREALLRAHLREAGREATALLRDLAVALLTREGRPLSEAGLAEALHQIDPEEWSGHPLFDHLRHLFQIPPDLPPGEAVQAILERASPGGPEHRILQRVQGDSRLSRWGPHHFGLAAWGEEGKLRYLLEEIGSASESGERTRLERAARSLEELLLAPEVRRAFEILILPEARRRCLEQGGSG